VVVVFWATSKWQAGGRNTRLIHGDKPVDEASVPVSARWGIGGAVAQKFAAEGCCVVMTTRHRANAEGLRVAVAEQGGTGLVVELDLAEPASIRAAFAEIRDLAGEPEVLVYNAGYIEGRDLPPEQELMEFFPDAMFETALDVACRGPSWWSRKSSRRCDGRGGERSCSPTTSGRCAAASGQPAHRSTTPGSCCGASPRR